LKFTSAKLPNVFKSNLCWSSSTGSGNVKFIGLQLDNQITWKNHIQLLLRKLGSACFVMRRLYYILNTDSLKLVYFAHFHTVIKHGKIFWGYQHNVNKVFILPKRILTIMRGWGYRSSSRVWFKQLEIWTVPCLYIYSLAVYVICSSCYLKLIFLYIQYTQGRKIIFINHWLNLHRYKVELLILLLRYLINCH